MAMIDPNRLASSILEHNKAVLAGFAAAILVSLFLMSQVQINYKLSDYLPPDAPSTIAIEALERSFDENVPNLSIMLNAVTLPETLEYKDRIAAAPGVDYVLWLDDVIDIRRPLAMEKKETVEAWYRDGRALLAVSIAEENLVENISTLREIVGERGVMAGNAIDQAESQLTTSEEIPRIMIMVLPLVTIILLLSTSSWFEPLLFLLTIGVAILLNEGTNICFGEISFLSRSTSAVLQLAVSMDYAVFLLHRFARYRQKGQDIRQSMARAMVESFSTIAASATTTFFGFLVLVLMRFRIGADLGLVLAKGIICSFVCVLVLLPVLAIATTRLMDRTSHRPLLPSFERFGRFVTRICLPLSVLVLLFVGPCFLAQKGNEFVYGSAGMHAEGSTVKEDADAVNRVFGESVQLVLLVPAGDVSTEAALNDALEKLEYVHGVVSYANTVGAQIPSEFLAPDQLSPFRSNGYSRFILDVNTSSEGERAFRAVDAVRETAAAYYGNAYHLLGQSVVSYDLKTTITADNRVVTVAVITIIALVLLFTFRSFSIPLLLLLAIQGATWLNFSIPYFTGAPLNYIGYQIVGAVQLGATVDYGILFAHHYLDYRKSMDRWAAVRQAVAGTTASILTPACILTIAAAMLGVVSSNALISQMGAILGRGAALSAAMVLLVLPGLLVLCDGLIMKTTFKANFKGEAKHETDHDRNKRHLARCFTDGDRAGAGRSV